MTDQMLSEQEHHIEAGLARVRNNIVSALAQGPNIAASNSETGKIQISPQSIIAPDKIGVDVKVGNEYKHIGDPIIAEKEVGKKNITAIIQMFMEDRGNNFFMGDYNSPDLYADILSNIHHSRNFREVFANLVSKTLNLRYDDQYGWTRLYGSKSSSPVEEKGIPTEIAEAIVAASASFAARRIDTAVTEEAKTIDREYVAAQRPLLENEIKTYQDQTIPDQEKKVNELAETQRRSEEEAQIKETRVKEMETQRKRLPELLFQKCGHIDPEKIAMLSTNLARQLTILGETGWIKKTVVYQPENLIDLSESLITLLDNSGIPTDLPVAFGFEKPAQAIAQTVENFIRNNIEISKKSPIEIFDAAVQLFVDGGQSSQIEKVLEGQRNLLITLTRQNREMASQFALDMAVRALSFDLLRQGESKQKGNILTDNFHYYNFQSSLDKITRENPEYKKVTDEAQKTKTISDQTIRQLSEQQHALDSMKNLLKRKQEDLSSLDNNERRVDSLKRAMLAKLLGISNPDNLILPGQQYRCYLNSQLVSDFVSAVFAGLPHFIANDTRHPKATEYIHSKIFQNKVEVSDVAQLADPLPSLVEAMLPSSHRNPGMATKLICDLIRRYPQNPHLLGFAGYDYEGVDTHLHERHIASDIVHRLVSGAVPHAIQPTVLNIDYELLKDPKWFTNPVAIRMLWDSRQDLIYNAHDNGSLSKEPSYEVISLAHLLDPLEVFNYNTYQQRFCLSREELEGEDPMPFRRLAPLKYPGEEPSLYVIYPK